MASKPETRLAMSIRVRLKLIYGADLVVWKIHGGPFQTAGVPDLVGCYRGRFFGFEVKRLLPSGEYASPLTLKQKRTLDVITRAGGIARVITSAHEAEAALAESDRGR